MFQFSLPGTKHEHVEACMRESGPHSAKDVNINNTRQKFSPISAKSQYLPLTYIGYNYLNIIFILFNIARN